MSNIDLVVNNINEINKECIVLSQVGEVICDLMTNGHPRDWNTIKQIQSGAVVQGWNTFSFSGKTFQQLCEPEKLKRSSIFSFFSRNPCPKFVPNGEKYKCNNCNFNRSDHLCHLKKNGKHRCDKFLESIDKLYCNNCGFEKTEHAYNVSYTMLSDDVKSFLSSLNMEYTMRVAKITNAMKTNMTTHPEFSMCLMVIKNNIDKFNETYKRVNALMYVGGVPHMPN